MIDQQQAKFEGYGLVEIVGHQRVAGFVTTEYFGNVAVFHVVMPEVAAEEIEIPTRQWIDTEYLEAGSRVRISRPSLNSRAWSRLPFGRNAPRRLRLSNCRMTVPRMMMTMVCHFEDGKAISRSPSSDR